MATDELIAKARSAGVLAADKGSVTIQVTVPGYKPVNIIALVDMHLFQDSPVVAAQAALEVASHGIDEFPHWRQEQ